MAIDVSKISPLGFGCMRFAGRETNEIDLEYTQKMIDIFIAAGGNYFDTAWAYTNSEAALGATLVKTYPRDSYYLASKCVAWTGAKSTVDLEKQLNDSLTDLGVEYLDLYMMHNLGGFRTACYDDMNAWEWMRSIKERGLVKHIGLSAHCTPEEIEQFAQSYPDAEFIQLQVNYQDWDDGGYRERECVEMAGKYGLPVIVMEPVKGGLLANPPEDVKKIIDEELPNDTYATAALRFSASAPGVFVTLSGMNDIAQVEDNCRAFKDFKPLSEAEIQVFDKIRAAMASSENIPCTGCEYCAKVCPQGIGISGAMTVLNQFINYGDAVAAKGAMGMAIGFNKGKKMPEECIRCGACEEACPQNIKILECFDRIEAEIMPAELPPMPVGIRMMD